MSRRDHRAAAGIAVALSACVAACGAASDATGGGAFAGVPRLDAVVEARIDGYAEDLVPISWVGVSPRGVVAIFQGQDAVVRFFDADGTRLGEFGGAGSGPGEFERLVRAGWRGDSLWVSDMALRRVTLITPELTLGRMLPPLPGAEPAPQDRGRLPVLMTAAPYAIHDGDTLLVSGFPSRTDPVSSRFETGMYRVLASGRVLGSVKQGLPDALESPSYPLGASGVAYAHLPFMPWPYWLVAPYGERIVTLTTELDAGTFTVTSLDPRGDTIFARAYAYEPSPVPPAVRDSAIDAEVTDVRVAGERGRIQSELRERTPHVYPPATALVLANDGATWIGLARDGGGTRSWLRLDAAGEPDAMIELPDNVTLGAADGDVLWATERDEVGVESVVRYRLR